MTIVSFFALSYPLDCFFFFFNDTAPPEIYPLPLPDALPILWRDDRPHPPRRGARLRLGQPVRAPLFAAHPDPLAATVGRLGRGAGQADQNRAVGPDRAADRKSTRLNSSHDQISYAVFCLKKK